MKFLIYICLLFAAAFLGCSVAMTVQLFKCFGNDNDQVERLKKYRVRMVASYAACVVFITLAAVIKIIFA